MQTTDPTALGGLALSYGGVAYGNSTPDALASAGVPADVILAAVKAVLAVRVDAVAEALRSAIVTSGTGQAMEYQQAQVEAFDALAATSAPAAGTYPMLEASIGIDIDPSTGKAATDVLGVARSVKAAFSAWLAIGAAIRGARLRGKDQIEAATTVEAAIAAFAAITWPAA